MLETGEFDRIATSDRLSLPTTPGASAIPSWILNLILEIALDTAKKAKVWNRITLMHEWNQITVRNLK
jgi:hypothetical protein